jgi:aldose 1-epimerase
LTIRYEGHCDRVTVFNMTNHSHFNLAGHDHPERAMKQILTMPARHYTVTDLWGFPTGELRSVEGTPMDFRTPKALSKSIRGLFRGYDHTFEVFCQPCAVLCDPISGRTMSVTTDCPGVQIYTGGGSREPCKDGIRYGKRAGVCFETQFYPDAVNHPQWKQPFTKEYHSETTFRFGW